MEHIRGQTAFGVGGFAFVHLSLLCGAELDLQLISKGVEPTLGLQIPGQLDAPGQSNSTHVFSHVVHVKQERLEQNEVDDVYMNDVHLM